MCVDDKKLITFHSLQYMLKRAKENGVALCIKEAKCRIVIMGKVFLCKDYIKILGRETEVELKDTGDVLKLHYEGNNIYTVSNNEYYTLYLEISEEIVKEGIEVKEENLELIQKECINEFKPNLYMKLNLQNSCRTIELPRDLPTRVIVIEGFYFRTAISRLLSYSKNNTLSYRNIAVFANIKNVHVRNECVISISNTELEIVNKDSDNTFSLVVENCSTAFLPSLYCEKSNEALVGLTDNIKLTLFNLTRNRFEKLANLNREIREDYFDAFKEDVSFRRSCSDEINEGYDHLFEE